MKFVEEHGAFFDVLLVERLQDHVAGAVFGVAAALDGGLAKLAGVAAELALGDLAFLGARKRQAHVLKLVDRLDHVFGKNLGGVLVGQVIAPFDGVVHVPFPVVFLDIAERRADAALRRAGVRAGRVELGDAGHRHIAFGRIQGRH